MKVLWLEDIFSQVGDFEDLLIEKGYVPLKFETISKLIDYLVDLKEKSRLYDICLILDIMILNTLFIFSPKEWNGIKDRNYKTMNEGEDAGLLFYEKLILQDACGIFQAHNIEVKKFLDKPIPVIFLTTIPDDKSNRVFASLENRWVSIKSEVKNSYWVYKWDKNGKKRFIQAIEEIKQSLEVNNGKADNK